MGCESCALTDTLLVLNTVFVVLGGTKSFYRQSFVLSAFRVVMSSLTAADVALLEAARSGDMSLASKSILQGADV